MEDWREKFDTKLAILMGNRAEAEVIAADVAEVLHHFGQEYSPEQVRKMTTEELIGLKDECLGTHVLEAMLRNRAKVMFHYEKQDLVMEAGDVFHNFNGSSYRLMEKYDDRTMLFMQESNGMFVVAQGVDGYVRYPKNTGPTEGNVEYGIEWGRGTYLGSVPSCIDFARLRREYGKEPPANEKGEYEIEVREVLSWDEVIDEYAIPDEKDEMGTPDYIRAGQQETGVEPEMDLPEDTEESEPENDLSEDTEEPELEIDLSEDMEEPEPGNETAEDFGEPAVTAACIRWRAGT